jgi:hypothetical protein
VDIELRVLESQDPVEELSSLYDWLSRDDAFRGRVRMSRAAPKPDEMGAVVDVLLIALGAGGAGTVLAGSLSTWITSRRSTVRLRLRYGKGREVEIDADRVKDPGAFLAQALREIDVG